MKMEELQAFCDDCCFDYAEVDETDENGKGIVFHWDDPKNPEHEVVHVKQEVFDTIEPKELAKLVYNGKNLIHMTRVCGYFSQMANWNPSKLGEAKDRQKGDYNIPTDVTKNIEEPNERN
jgi:hypothetical protein